MDNKFNYESSNSFILTIMNKLVSSQLSCAKLIGWSIMKTWFQSNDAEVGTTFFIGFHVLAFKLGCFMVKHTYNFFFRNGVCNSAKHFDGDWSTLLYCCKGYCYN